MPTRPIFGAPNTLSVSHIQEVLNRHLKFQLAIERKIVSAGQVNDRVSFKDSRTQRTRQYVDVALQPQSQFTVHPEYIVAAK